MIPPLTKRRAQAIANALRFYLAGEPNDGDELKRDDYKAALEWADEQVRRRTRPVSSTEGKTL